MKDFAMVMVMVMVAVMLGLISPYLLKQYRRHNDRRLGKLNQEIYLLFMSGSDKTEVQICQKLAAQNNSREPKYSEVCELLRRLSERGLLERIQLRVNGKNLPSVYIRQENLLKI